MCVLKRLLLLGVSRRRPCDVFLAWVIGVSVVGWKVFCTTMESSECFCFDYRSKVALVGVHGINGCIYVVLLLKEQRLELIVNCCLM